MTLGGSISFKEPATCDTVVETRFYDFGSKSGHSFYITGNVHTGDIKVKLTGRLPRDFPAGEFRSADTNFRPCAGDGDMKPLDVAPKTFLVTAYSNPNKYPTAAELSLTVNQKQFFDTKILELNDISVQLTNHLEDGAAETVQLHEFLVQIVKSAKVALDITEKQYRADIMKSQGNPPAFFADFRKQYDDLIHDLAIPAPGTKAHLQMNPSLIFVGAQLKKRDPQTRPTNNRSGTLPPSAGRVDTTVNDNIAVYRYIKTTGRLTFDAILKSVPTGASVQYKKVLDDDFTDYSSPTNISRATFELATYIFKFSEAGCSDRKKRINPYQDPNPNIEVEFNDCGRK